MSDRSAIPESALVTALTRLAIEESNRLESAYKSDALPISRGKIDAVRDAHQAEDLRLIRRQTRAKGFPAVQRMLALAACVALMIAGVYSILNQPPAPDLPVTPLATSQASFDQALAIPEDWTGHYYPTWLPEGWQQCSVETLADGQTVHYISAEGSELFAFTEYVQPTAFQPQAETQLTYRQLDAHTAALMARNAGQLQLIWDTPDNQTLCVIYYGTDENVALKIAQMIEKIIR